ncbi:hypothetical protein N7492_002810 [Penicillium capsulatum]|uniref:Uncharacterized protein n=1 Tax=Penicillium capsulatum TaxID=69766 RepID=A0A9W9IJC4_9EURO|nr:hypothetical protein N7492_002810 [Penicillium capsulatum]KAJ6122593.1 hypothetical protein N7512_005058 [Penicillium capsulatum]
MSISACSTHEQGQCAGDAAPCSETATQPDAPQPLHGSGPVQSSPSLLASLWSPLNSFLSISNSANARIDPGSMNESKSVESTGEDPEKTQSSQLEAKPSNREPDLTENARSKSTELEQPSPPEACYAPHEVPTFKALQKKRLTGTRTKQLLRAASRAHDDPPPPPELGLCCGKFMIEIGIEDGNSVISPTNSRRTNINIANLKTLSVLHTGTVTISANNSTNTNVVGDATILGAAED